MDPIGLISSITEAAIEIDAGRKGFATRGKAEEGRILYEGGIALALSSFREAQSTADPHTLIMAEYAFLTQELQFCTATEKRTLNSLNKAIQHFDDAFLALKVIEDKSLYTIADSVIPHDKDYRVKGYPKDSFHIACGSHKTRIKNILTSPGIDPIEKDLLEQRLVNLSAAQGSYIEKQKVVMENNNV